MATKKQQAPGRTNFDLWKESLTPKDIADRKFVALSCMGCPAHGQACSRYDTACRANFMRWARSAAEPEAAYEAAPEAKEEVGGDE
jgi:hypothetical protein